MPKLSAGILAHRQNTAGNIEILLVHPGGPFFKNKDEGVWSVPKGEYAEGEDPLLAAKREFEEETGNILAEGEFIQLIPVKIKSGKVISAWAVKANFDQPFVKSNYFEMEWPPRSGKKQSFLEVDKAEWFSLKEAAQKINAGQLGLLEQLETLFEKINK